MADAKISFRIPTDRKSSLIKTAQEGELTLTQYLLYIIDMHEAGNSLSMIHTVAERSNLENFKTDKDLSEHEFKIEFENEISNAYLKGYQHGRKEIIKSKY